MGGKNPLGARKDEQWYAISTEPSVTKTPIGVSLFCSVDGLSPRQRPKTEEEEK
jgi:hypothetical protein